MPKGEGKFLIKNTKNENEWDNFNVISTDYNSYAIVYKCVNHLFSRVKQEYVWVYMRHPYDPTGTPADELEYNRVTQVAQEFIENNIPEFDF